MSRQKKVFVFIFLGISLILMILPLLISFNDVLTRIVERNFLYLWIQKSVVPIEAKAMGGILMQFGYNYSYSPTNSLITVNGVVMEITWNCLGWQSLLLLLVSLFIGFNRKYKLMSILEAGAIGILGTLWLNILRMIFTVLLAVHTPEIFRIVFHDYLAALTTVVWLFFFWWFSYKYVLVEKEPFENKEEIE